ncbi:type IIL restriction-modification enzyme MmeI [Acuticoccus sp.]|uniref:type IIL restriction-modification enzyme MmeI n=1 Tax=Acuticoccus sp. TaxID=1904378 RepID=UPI003B52DB0C
MTPDELIAKWAPSGGAENANAQHFVLDLCDLIGVPRPSPTVPSDAANSYVFERSVRHVTRDAVSTNRIDCYKRSCFILESKQSSLPSARRSNEGQGELLPEHTAAVKGGTAKRGTPAWDRAMRRAYLQAKGYVGDLPPDHAPPLFLMVIDVGNVIELYADFSGQGRNYTQFPNRREFSIPLEALREEAVRERLAKVWLEPASLNPAIRAAEVTRDVAERLARVARVAKRLEGKHDPAAVATFLMRCLFTMFAEDVELIPKASFTKLLTELKDEPRQFVPQLEHLWRTMDEGGFEPRMGAVLKRFNGTLFKERRALPLDREGIHELAVAASKDWRDVEPAIFGTLLERALNPRERARLGAHYTPRAYVERLVVPTIIRKFG